MAVTFKVLATTDVEGTDISPTTLSVGTRLQGDFGTPPPADQTYVFPKIFVECLREDNSTFTWETNQQFFGNAL